MKKQLFLLLFFSSVFTVVAFTQENKDTDESKFGIKFSGYIKNDVFYDTRQTVSLREGHFLLYPEKQLFDSAHSDIYDKSNSNILAIQTRLVGNITGPDAFGAKTSGLIEGEFFGNADADINGFRLRHAYIKLNWDNSELMVGQYWHPFFVTDCFPGTVSFNTGAPFQPFSRNPQVRITETMGNFKFIFAVISQRDFASIGPNGTTASSDYLRNSPGGDAHLQLCYEKKNEETGTDFLAGIGGEYKNLWPRLKTDSMYKAEETVTSYSGIVFIKYKNPKITAELEAVYGQNMSDALMLGGYGVKYRDPVTDTTLLKRDDRKYTTLDNISFWTDIHTNGEKVQGGIFAGYTKNLGSFDNLDPVNPIYYTYKEGYFIDYIYRISPRVIFNSGKTRFAGEVEYTAAAFGSEVNSLAEVQKSKEVANIRLLLSVYYFF